MKFDDLDAGMRVFETAHDHCVLPGLWMVVRLDGRGFTRLTKEVHRFEAPFDERFRDAMVATAEHLLANSGCRVAYAHTHSDEISLLLAQADGAYGRKLRKLLSLFAAEASAKFSLTVGSVAAFDARVSQLPSVALVADYFRWRQEDAARNALNAHCYWLLRRQRGDAAAATAVLTGMSVAAKRGLLAGQRADFDALPPWQSRGVGLWWEEFEKVGTNPRTGAGVTARRRRVRRELQLPVREAYAALVRARAAAPEAAA